MHAGGRVQLKYPANVLKRHEPLFRQREDQQMSTEIKRYGEQTLMNIVHSSVCHLIK